MAAKLLKRGNRPYIQFPGRDGRRKTVALGEITDKAARAILYHVERLAESALYGDTLPRNSAEWLETIPARLHAKLVDVGLAKPREVRPAVELGTFADAYIAGRTDVKKFSRNILRQTRRYLVAFFGEKRDLTTINRGDARDWHRGLGRSLATATVAAYLKRARQMFEDARDRKLIDENPFAGIKAGSQVNEDRRRFVPAVDILKVMEECPDAEWRAIFALSRFGGLRVPSETCQLRWTDVDFDKRLLTVRSSKTERYEGKDKRVVPIFPELLPWLREAFEQAEEGAVYVVARHRGENLRTTTLKFVERAGLVAWPKLFQNLRSSRQTELEDEFPTHVVCRWLGNSPTVARRHYLQTTDRHFEKAIGPKSAAQGAALRPALEAPVAHQNRDNAPKNASSGDVQCPRWESNKHAFSEGIQGVKGPALRKALRRLRQTAFSIYRAETSPYRSRTPRGGGR